MKTEFMFTSESVTEGHPDKLCDQISDAIVDRFLSEDPYARVRAECAVSSAIVFIASRFASEAMVDLSHVARKVIKRIGYDKPDFSPQTCSILTAPQSLPVEKVWHFKEEELTEKEINRIAPKNQVNAFGFACNQSPDLMPLPIWLAHRVARQLTEVRKQRILPYLMPEGRVQVGVVYRQRSPYRIYSITIEADQRDSTKPSQKTVQRDIRETVVDEVFAHTDLKPDRKTRIIVNPDGPYEGGPTHHSGLTGRKSAIDTYGEFSRHSGKALSGKDPVRIDRIGAYAARHAAKNVVAAGLADECEVMVSYSLGIVHPVSLQVHTFGTGRVPDDRITDLVRETFEFRLAGILKEFNLRHLPAQDPTGFYQKLSAYGHFGRSDIDLPWEKTDRAEELGDEAK
jgi:S-adenosylmethionine synthetase